MDTNKLNNALADTITRATNGLDNAATFFVGQLPDVIQQLLTFKLIESLVTIGYVLALLVAGALLLKWCNGRRTRDEASYSEQELFTGACVIGGILYLVLTLALAVPALVVKTQTALMVWLAPKVYLIQYAADLIKK